MSKKSGPSTNSEEVNAYLDSTTITDAELFDWLTVRATKTLAKDKDRRLKKEAELLRAVRANLTKDDSTRG